MSAETPLRQEVDARGIARLVLDRPEKGNCYNQAMLDGLAAAVDRIAADPAVRVVVVRGEGKHFCVGAEIGAPEPPPSATRATIPGVCHALDMLAKPTIAFVHGACIGGGLALVSCCDVVIASPDAFFSLPEVRLGFAPGPLIPFFLRAIEPRGLRRYLLTGERFKADEAMRLGLVHQVCATGAGDETLESLIDEALLAGPGAVAQAKRLLRELAGTPVSPALLSELQHEFDILFKSPEAAEGRASFRDKRRPAWYPAPAPKP
ncbi:MAG: enoyl-CoA hydratase-related protein [Xanthobacteraceae bacterium]